VCETERIRQRACRARASTSILIRYRTVADNTYRCEMKATKI
jgi:hypothetical protein